MLAPCDLSSSFAQHIYNLPAFNSPIPLLSNFHIRLPKAWKYCTMPSQLQYFLGFSTGVLLPSVLRSLFFSITPQPENPQGPRILHPHLRWNVLSPPEEAELWDSKRQTCRSLPSTELSELLFENETTLLLSDRNGRKEAKIRVSGTLGDVLKEIHSFYKKMSNQFKKTHRKEWDPDLGVDFYPYYERETRETGLYLGKGMITMGIVWREGGWELDTTPAYECNAFVRMLLFIRKGLDLF